MGMRLGTFRVSSADGTLDGVTLGVNTTLVTGAQVTVLNDLTLVGGVKLSMSRVVSGVSVDGAAIVLPSEYDVGLNFAGSNQTLGGSGTVELYNYNSYSVGEERFVRVRSTGVGGLTIASGITIQDATNSMLVTLGDPLYPLRIEGTVVSQSTNSVSALRVTGSTVTNIGKLKSTSGILDVATSPDNFSGGNLTGGTWEVVGTGKIQIPAGNEIATLAANVVLDGAGATLRTGSADALAGLAEISGSGSLTITAGKNLTIPGSLINDGDLIVELGSSLTINPGDIFSATGTTTIGGSLAADAVTLSGTATLVGQGDVAAPCDCAQSGSIVAPGNSPGILNIGDFDLQTSATLDIEIGGPLVGTDYDQLNVTGTVTRFTGRQQQRWDVGRGDFGGGYDFDRWVRR